MINYNKSNSSISFFTGDVDAIRNNYHDQIDRAIESKDNVVEIRVSLDDIKSIGCNEKIQFNELIIWPIINSLSKKYDMNVGEIADFLAPVIRYPGEY